MEKLFKGAASIAAMATLGGCAVQDAYERKAEIESQTIEANEIRHKNEKITSSSSNVMMRDELFFAGESYRLSEKERLPEFFYENFSIYQLNPISLQDLISTIARETGMRIQITDDAYKYIDSLSDTGKSVSSEGGEGGEGGASFDASAAITDSNNLPGAKLALSVNHDGDLVELLDYITIKSNLFWRYENGQVYIYRLESKTFFVSIDPGKGSVSGSVKTGTSAGGGEGASSGSAHATTYEFAPDNYWNYIDKALEEMISTEGKFSSNRVIGIVTVRDTPDRLRQIENYIKEVNQLSNKRIAVSVEIYDVEIDEETAHGLNWKTDKLATAGAFYGGNSSGFSNELKSGVTAVLRKGILADTQLALDMFAREGKVSEITRHTVNTTNGISVPIQVVDEKTYVSKRSVTNDADGGDQEVDIETSVVNDGISMSILPRIIGKDRLAVNFAADVGKVMFETYGKKDEEIQLPQRSTKNFLQRLPLKSGETVMLVGFERTTKDVAQQGLPDSEAWALGGNMKSNEKKVVSVILVTPYILADK